MKVTVVIPTYNEAENLSAMTECLFSLGFADLNILVVDDASPDGTGEIADELARRFPGRFDVIHRQGKSGLGTAYLTGFQWALRNGADAVIQMDADFSHSPDYIPQLLEQIQRYDVVVGSRYVTGGKTDERWSWSRWLLSWFANSVWVRLILGLRSQDATAGFKCWRRSALERINLDHIRSNGYIFQVEMAYLSERLGLRIKEIPIYFNDRKNGQSKMSWQVKLEAALRVIEIRWHYRDSSLIFGKRMTVDSKVR